MTGVQTCALPILVADARRHGVTVRGPDVNLSAATATLEREEGGEAGGLVVRGYGVVRRPPAVEETTPGWRGLGRLGALALILVLLAHLAALLAPQALVAITHAHLRLYLLEGSGFLVGLVAVLAWGRVMLRHLRTEGPSLAGIGDSMLLALIAQIGRASCRERVSDTV